MKYPAPTYGILLGGLSLMLTGLLHAAPDSNRAISVDELETRRAEIFQTVDSDADGLVSAAEFSAHEPRFHPGSRPERKGHDGHRGVPDPAASDEQRHAHRAELDTLLFQALDRDGDGVLSDTEFSQAELAQARRTLMKERAFARLDRDGDGFLSADEFPPDRLSRLDTDADGIITHEEARQHTMARHHSMSRQYPSKPDVD